MQSDIHPGCVPWRLRILLICLISCFHGLVRAQTPTETILHTFTAYAGGTNPLGRLFEGQDGEFYGTTEQNGRFGFGTVFKITTQGSLTDLHDFNSTDGSYPHAGVVQGSDGTLYGAADDGGANGVGCVFKLNPDGTGFQVLYNFIGDSLQLDSAVMPNEVIVGSDGALYGTTIESHSGGGAVYRLNTDGSGFTILHGFSGADGYAPFVGVIQGQDGSLYGTTNLGGANGKGVVYRVNLPKSHYTAPSRGNPLVPGSGHGRRSC